MTKAPKDYIVTILWGLPASGKTTYAQTLCPPEPEHWLHRSKNYNHIINIDELAREHPLTTKLVNIIASHVVSYQCEPCNIILDGLVTTNLHARNLIQAIKQAKCKPKTKFAIHWWAKDVEACLHNDQGRRKRDSTATIKCLPFEEPSSFLIEEFDITVVKHDVERKSGYAGWRDALGINSDELKSEKWCIGGSWANCWGQSGSVGIDPQPTSFNELDIYLELNHPNITILQYKRIYRELVRTEQYNRTDYYGSGTTHAYYTCSLPKLFDMLVGMGQLDPDKAHYIKVD